MRLLVEWAEYLISAMDSVGSFLMFTPFDDIEVLKPLSVVFPGLEDVSIGVIILGSGLITVISIKILRFFLGLDA